MAEGKPPLIPVCVEDAQGTSPHASCPVGYQLVWEPKQSSNPGMPVSELFQESAVFVMAILITWLLGKAVGWSQKNWSPDS